MSALKRFLDRDSVAKAAVVTALSMGVLATAPVGMANPPPNAGTAFSAPGRVLVALDMESCGMEGATKPLAAGTRRCLRDLGRILAADGAASGDPAATRAAMERSAAALGDDRSSDIDLAEVKGMAERDTGLIRCIAGMDPDRLDRDTIEAMETYGRSPGH